jgi:WD40 repeat protein
MLIFTYYKDGSIVLESWATSSNDRIFPEIIRTETNLSNYKLDFSNDGSLLAIGSEDGTVSIYGVP